MALAAAECGRTAASRAAPGRRCGRGPPATGRDRRAAPRSRDRPPCSPAMPARGARASDAGTRSPRRMMSRSARRRSFGRRRAPACAARSARVTRMLAREEARQARASPSPCVQPPAGASATTERARPRLASSSASAPPIELPTMCACRRPTRRGAPSSESVEPANVIGLLERIGRAALVSVQRRRDHLVALGEARQQRVPVHPRAR